MTSSEMYQNLNGVLTNNKRNYNGGFSMELDINKIIDTLSTSWANDLAEAKKHIAILTAENERLKAKISELESSEGHTEENAE